MFKYLQRTGKALMLPIAALPIAGILLGIGGAFLGIAYYALLLVLSFLWRKTLDIEQLQLTIPLMCTLSGVAGVLRLGRNTNKS